jgi:hypothetical protein
MKSLRAFIVVLYVIWFAWDLSGIPPQGKKNWFLLTLE